MWKLLLVFVLNILIALKAEAAVLECSWDSQNKICTPLSMTSVTQPDEIITINGKAPSYTNTGTTQLTFTNQMFTYIPTGLFTIFTNLDLIKFENCSASGLVTDSVKNCANLLSLSVLLGTIPKIPAGFAQTCSKLNIINLEDDNIETFEVGAFKGLTSLGILSLLRNKIRCIPTGLFQSIPSLREVDLRFNLLTEIDSNTFANLPNFLDILISDNFISYMPTFNFTGTPNILYLTFGPNPIKAIQPNFCSNFENRPDDSITINAWNFLCAPDTPFPNFVVKSSICQSSLVYYNDCFTNWTSSMTGKVSCPWIEPPVTQPPTTVPPPTVPLTTAIVTTPTPTPGSCPSDKICRYFLDQYNRYTCILDGVDSVLTSISGNHLITFADSNVRRVIFSNSFLSRIPPILFQKFISLEYLTVSNCSMSAINTNTFTACGSLKYFDASDNFITTVDGASFKSCAALEVIDLTGNKFDMISGQLFVNNPTLKAVYINRPPAMVLV